MRHSTACPGEERRHDDHFHEEKCPDHRAHVRTESKKEHAMCGDYFLVRRGATALRNSVVLDVGLSYVALGVLAVLLATPPGAPMGYRDLCGRGLGERTVTVVRATSRPARPRRSQALRRWQQPPGGAWSPHTGPSGDAPLPPIHLPHPPSRSRTFPQPSTVQCLTTTRCWASKRRSPEVCSSSCVGAQEPQIQRQSGEDRLHHGRRRDAREGP